MLVLVVCESVRESVVSDEKSEKSGIVCIVFLLFVCSC